MPALTKQVRFSSINAMYSPMPSIPYAFTTSISSTTSSTPSRTSSHSKSSDGSKSSKRSKHRRHVSKLTTRPRPFPLDLPDPIMRIHFLLAFSPYQPSPLSYDLSTSPSIIEALYPANVLSESATDPPVSSLTITCPHLKWDIPVQPVTLSPRKGPYISVLDVLHAFYRNLRTAVHPLEYEALPSVEATANVNEAYFTRCSSIVDSKARQEEHSKGVKRVDFLMGRNRFLGLSRLSSRKGGSMVWELNVS